MRDHDDRLAGFSAQSAEDAKNFLSGMRIKIPRRLISHDQRRISD